MDAASQKRWITCGLIGLLFVIVLMGLVGSCVVVAINNARESGRRLVCMNNMRNVATSLINYESSRNLYPGYSNVLVTKDGKMNVDTKTGKKASVSLIILILRQLDRPDLDVAWKTPASQSTPEIEAKKQAPIEMLVCPSDPRFGQDGIPLNYVANCGMKDWAGSATMPRDWEENGVFFDRFTGDPRVAADKDAQIPITKMSSRFIAMNDGLQNTILMTENVDSGNYTDTDETQVGVLWNPKGAIDKSKDPPHLSPPDPNMKINTGTGLSKTQGGSAAFARPSSNHSGGVNVVFCDSHLRFLSDKIDYYVYCLLMSPRGSHVREPGSDVVVPDFSPPLPESWIY